MKTKNILFGSATGLIVSLLIAQATFAGSHQSSKKDIVDTAVEAGSFKTLAAALSAAGLVDTLKGEGPLTVLAPTDEAFAKLPKGMVEKLLKPENREQLVEILTYHVIVGKVAAKDVVKLDRAETVAALDVQIEFRDSALFVNESRVIKTDIETSNGIIHVIDRVLLPPEKMVEAGAAGDVSQMIALAIEKGAPQYNHGNVHACADIYEMTARGIMQISTDKLSSSDRKILARALEMAVQQDAEDRAWTFRRAFDRIQARAMAAK